MTMIAVVAMRSTTLDIKMTTNTTQSRRAFESSEGSRDALTPLLTAHVFYHGWPVSMGGTVPDTANFTAIAGMTIADATKRYDLGDNGSFAQLPKADGTSALTPTRTTADMTYANDVNGNGVMDQSDMNAQIWVTRLGTLPATGTNVNSNSADQGVGGGAANKYIIFDLRSDGSAVGNARSRTGADYRSIIR
jgi:Tfp pilus assembly protein PilX